MPGSYKSLTFEDEKRMLSAVEPKAVALRVPRNIAVGDAGGRLVGFLRRYGALIGSIDLALGKAITVRLFDKAVDYLAELAASGKPLFDASPSNSGEAQRWIDRSMLGAVVISLAVVGPALAQPRLSFEDCATLYGLWERYESPSTQHTGQKARAEFALEWDCLQGRYESGMNELRKLLQRGLVPLPPPEISKQPEKQAMKFYLF